MATALPPPGKTARVLCQLCQMRKTKCDRRSPCSNCVKAHAKCIPSTPAPARRRKRPNQDLQQRLAKCEELLQTYATKPPDDGQDGHQTAPSQGSALKPTGKLILDDSGGVQFVDSMLWASVHDELRAMREILDDDDDTYATPNTNTSNPSAGDTPDDGSSSLLFSESPTEDLSGLYPNPAQILHLWQNFLDRVNPVTKVIHVPSVHPLIIEAATKPSNLSKVQEPLVFSIFATGANAMTSHQCLSTLGISKHEATSRFYKGTRIALTRIGILRHFDLSVLQAFVIYQLTMSSRTDKHEAWIMNGVIVRIALKMGLHRDGLQLGISVFETEMRRRIWWQILMADTFKALTAGMGQYGLPQSWDTKRPSNIDDSDLHKSMTVLEPKDGPTEMVFVIVGCELVSFIQRSGLSSILHQFESGASNSTPSPELSSARKCWNESNVAAEELMRKHCDLSKGPVHKLAYVLLPDFMQRLKWAISPSPTRDESYNPEDRIFEMVVSSLEHAMGLYETLSSDRTFLWVFQMSFQEELLFFTASQLRSQTSGPLVERAWAVMEKFFPFNADYMDFSDRVYSLLASLLVPAWKKRESIQCQSGLAPVMPQFIYRLQTQYGGEENDEDWPTPPEFHTPGMAADGNVLDQSVDFDFDLNQIFGAMEASTLSWDMTGDSSGHGVVRSNAAPDTFSRMSGHQMGDDQVQPNAPANLNPWISKPWMG